MSAATYVNQARRAAGLSQRELSRRTGVPQATLRMAGTPAEIVNKLHATITQVLGTPEMKDRLDKAGAELRPQTDPHDPAGLVAVRGRGAGQLGVDGLDLLLGHRLVHGDARADDVRARDLEQLLCVFPGAVALRQTRQHAR